MQIKHLISLLGIFFVLSFGLNYASAHTGINDSLPSPNRVDYVFSSINAPCSEGNWHPTIPNANLGGDTDGDGICDLWETPTGLVVDFKPPNGDGAGQRFTYSYPCGAGAGQDSQCPSLNKKDVYLELDWMKDPANSHVPLAGVVQAVKDAWAASPVSNPDGTTGIVLHVQYGEWPASATSSQQGNTKFHKDSIYTNLSNNPSFPGFYRLKQYTFGTVCERFADTTCPADSGISLHINSNYLNPLVKNPLTAKFQVFHYAMVINKKAEKATESGWGEVDGNDHVWSLGGWSPVMGNAEEQKAVFMHEFGHNFNLDHGGTGTTPNNPNYFSVMNPSFEFIPSDPNTIYDFDPCRPLDYSWKAMNTLNEAALSESAGVKDSSGAGYLYPSSPWSCSKSWTGNAAGASLPDHPTPVPVAGTDRFFWYSTPGSSTLNAFDRTDSGVNWDNDVPYDDNDSMSQNINANGGTTMQSLASIDDWNTIIANMDFGGSTYAILSSAGGNNTGLDVDSPPPFAPDEECKDVIISDPNPLFTQSFTTGCREISMDRVPTPLMQIKNGVSPEDVKCNDYRNLVLKSDRAACVGNAALIRLLENGWTEIKKS